MLTYLTFFGHAASKGCNSFFFYPVLIVVTYHLCRCVASICCSNESSIWFELWFTCTHLWLNWGHLWHLQERLLYLTTGLHKIQQTHHSSHIVSHSFAPVWRFTQCDLNKFQTNLVPFILVLSVWQISLPYINLDSKHGKVCYILGRWNCWSSYICWATCQCNCWVGE